MLFSFFWSFMPLSVFSHRHHPILVWAFCIFVIHMKTRLCVCLPSAVLLDAFLSFNFFFFCPCDSLSYYYFFLMMMYALFITIIFFVNSSAVNAIVFCFKRRYEIICITLLYFFSYFLLHKEWQCARSRKYSIAYFSNVNVGTDNPG